MTLTVNDIEKLSYTDFIGLVNQWNVPPGAHNTVTKWKTFGNVTSDSTVLEVACTTGFSSRELAKMTGCTGVGIDISAPSVEKAVENQHVELGREHFKYVAIDGYAYETDQEFTHIVFGAALRFFPDPARMLQKCFAMCEDTAYLLPSEFWVTKEIPQKLIKEAESVFHMTPTQVGYKEVMGIYEGLDVMYEDKNTIEMETDAELDHYTCSTIDRAQKKLGFDNDVRQTMYDRLYRIKDMSNKLRPYQNYNVVVLRYNKAHYPSRYVELF